MAVSFTKKAGKHFLEAVDKGKYEHKRKVGRPRGRAKLRIFPKRICKIKLPTTNIKKFVNSLPPWGVEIKGKEGVPVFRSCADVVKYQSETKRIIELFYSAGIIKRSKPCGRKRDGLTCDGTLVATHDPKAKGYWAKHGGYYYKCVNNGSRKGQCTPRANNMRASILGDTLIFNRISPFQLLKLLYSYSMISHRVK